MRTQGGVPAQLGVLPRGWAAGCCEPQGVVQKGGDRRIHRPEAGVIKSEDDELLCSHTWSDIITSIYLWFRLCIINQSIKIQKGCLQRMG